MRRIAQIEAHQTAEPVQEAIASLEIKPLGLKARQGRLRCRNSHRRPSSGTQPHPDRGTRHVEIDVDRPLFNTNGSNSPDRRRRNHRLRHRTFLTDHLDVDLLAVVLVAAVHRCATPRSSSCTSCRCSRRSGRFHVARSVVHGESEGEQLIEELATRPSGPAGAAAEYRHNSDGVTPKRSGDLRTRYSMPMLGIEASGEDMLSWCRRSGTPSSTRNAKSTHR